MALPYYLDFNYITSFKILEMVAIFATDFEPKRWGTNSQTFIVNIVQQDETKYVQHGQDICVPMYGKEASAYFENNGFPTLKDIKWPPGSAQLIPSLRLALKVIPSQRADSKNEMEQRRLSILPLVKISTGKQTCVNVQKYYGADYTSMQPGESGRMCYILAELCEGSPLDEWMSMRKRTPNEYTITLFTKQILQGLEFLHRNQIIHRDVKGANITVIGNSERVKITDLDMARPFSGSTPYQGLENAAGTVPFVSPEMAELSVVPAAKGMPVGPGTDIWSLGCVFIQMIQKGQPPFLTKSQDGSGFLRVNPTSTFQEMHHYNRLGYKPKYPCSKTCGHGCKGTECQLLTDEVKAFLSKCLILDPSKRPSAYELLQSPYFHPSFRIVPEIKSREQQRFLVSRYELKTAAQLEEEARNHQPLTKGHQLVVLLDPDEQDETMARLQEKVRLPEIAANSVTPGWVSIISPIDSSASEPELLMVRKQDMYKVLVKDIAPKTKHVIQHLAVRRSEDALELRVFTESEGNMETLSSLSKKVIFRKLLIPDFTRQILEGLAFLHQYGIIHKDIRCSNILVQQSTREDGSPEYLLKIGHFEKASHFTGESTPRNFISSPEGSSRFASKEMQELLSFDIKEPENVGRATDVFSLGCTVIEMYQRSMPRWIYMIDEKLKEYSFSKPDTNSTDFLANMYNLLTFRAEPDTSEVGDGEALNFVQSCHKRPSTSRPTCERLQLHPFISGLKAPLPA